MDLANYQGFKEVNTNGKTGKVTVIDTRILELEKLKAKAELKKQYEEKILENAPAYKQRNIALGLIQGEEANKLIGIIRAFQTEYEARKAAIDNSKTCDDVVDALLKT